MDPTPYPPDDPRGAARARFIALIGGADADPPLAETALVIALEEYPALQVRVYLARLHAFSAVVADRMRQATAERPEGFLTAADRIAILNRYVFDELGFRGDREACYDPRSSFLNDVIDRRLGIPLTLSVVYMELARGAGLRLAGVAFPGHFLVKTQAVHPARLLIDLKLVYLRQDDPERAWHAAERRRLLAPDEPSELLECGILCGRLGRYTQGAAALTRYLETVPEGRERTQAETELARQRHWLSRLN
jgi:regulator of sirC expression with transglutaminase-like and TPR domain